MEDLIPDEELEKVVDYWANKVLSEDDFKDNHKEIDKRFFEEEEERIR